MRALQREHYDMDENERDLDQKISAVSYRSISNLYASCLTRADGRK